MSDRLIDNYGSLIRFPAVWVDVGWKVRKRPIGDKQSTITTQKETGQLECHPIRHQGGNPLQILTGAPAPVGAPSDKHSCVTQPGSFRTSLSAAEAKATTQHSAAAPVHLQLHSLVT